MRIREGCRTIRLAQLAVRALVLSNTTTELGEASRQRHESRLKLVVEKGLEALLPGVIDMAFHRLPKDDRYTRYLEHFRQNNPKGYGSIALGMVGSDNTNILTGLAIPALVAVGRYDILLPCRAKFTGCCVILNFL